MPHISYSELKDWVFCAFYHKLTRVDKIEGFKGNAYTAFGTAVHSVCEKKLLQQEVDEEFFIQEFEKCINKLDDDVEVDQKLVENMRTQGKELIPEIQEALDQYFDEYEVLAAEMPLYEPIEGEEDYVFKGYIDAVIKTADDKIHIFDYFQNIVSSCLIYKWLIKKNFFFHNYFIKFNIFTSVKVIK